VFDISAVTTVQRETNDFANCTE